MIMTSQAVLLKESMFLEPTLPAKRARYHHQKIIVIFRGNSLSSAIPKRTGLCNTTMRTPLLNY